MINLFFKKKGLGVILMIPFLLLSCKKWLDVLPEDRIIADQFWEDENDVHMALTGLYSVLRSENLYGYGPRLDAMNANGYQWGATDLTAIGNGSVTPSTGGIISGRWSTCFQLINRCNYFLENIDGVEMAQDEKELDKAEAHFLRGVAYSLLAESYGGVPLLDKSITVDDAKELKRNSLNDTWNFVVSDYDFASKKLGLRAPEIGRATKGAALGMKARALLYQGKYEELLKVIDTIDSFNIYSLFPSYHGLFQVENENNSEVIFDVQFIEGNHELGNRFDRGIQPQNLKNGVNGASRIAATQNMVDAYEMINGLQINDPNSGYDSENPYKNRDPRLDFTILRPGAEFQGQLYPTEVKSHTGQRDPYLIRKYTIENMPISGNYNESPLNFIILRYADIVLSKAEAIIETNGDIKEAIKLINEIRNSREDVKIGNLNENLSRDEARKALRHERRVEFAFEGLYWADIKRWDIGSEIYPIDVRDINGGLIETKFSSGYDSRFQFLPIPDGELSLDPNLEQNPGW